MNQEKLEQTDCKYYSVVFYLIRTEAQVVFCLGCPGFVLFFKHHEGHMISAL